MRGFTLVEMLAAIFVIGLVVVSATPFIRDSLRKNQANTAARDVYTDLALARSLAVKTGFPHKVQFCPAADVGGGSVPGYVVIECSDGAGNGGLTLGACNPGTYGVAATCAEVANESPAPEALRIRKEVNLLRGRYSGSGSLAATTGVGFGSSGIATALKAVPYAPSSPVIPDGTTPAGLPGGLDLDCGEAGLAIYFRRNGQAVDAQGGACSGVIYLSNRRDQVEEAGTPGGLSGDSAAYRNRAVEFSSAGGLRVWRYDPLYDGGAFR